MSTLLKPGYARVLEKVKPRKYEGGGQPPPPQTPDIDPWGHGFNFPIWAQRVVCFLAGMIAVNLLYYGPLQAALFILMALSIYVVWATTKRAA